MENIYKEIDNDMVVVRTYFYKAEMDCWSSLYRSNGDVVFLLKYLNAWKKLLKMQRDFGGIQ